MDIRSWRQTQGLSLRALAEKLNIAGTNPSRTLQRWESGEAPCPVEVVERAKDLSDGLVTAEDFHVVRLAFVRRQEPIAETGDADAERAA